MKGMKRTPVPTHCPLEDCVVVVLSVVGEVFAVVLVDSVLIADRKNYFTKVLTM